ncbi:MAG: family 16 glycoside hydrolase [Planctomycetota bacterium]|jgi:hypothetical protein
MMHTFSQLKTALSFSGLCLSVSAFGGPAGSAESLVSNAPGKASDETIVFSADFSGTDLPSEIIPMHKTRWSVEDGVLVGQPATAEQQKKNKEAGPGHWGHNAKMTVVRKFEDAVAEFDFRFEEEGRTVVFVGNAPGRSHLFNLNLASDKASVMRFRDKKLKGDKNEILTEVPVRLPARQWHKVKVVMQGPAVAVSLNGKEMLSVSHERFAGRKHNPTFRTAGPAVLQLDNILLRN